MMIGDSEVDIQTARNADMIATAVNYGFGIHDRAQHPADIYLDRMSDLLGSRRLFAFGPIALRVNRPARQHKSNRALPSVAAVGRLGA